MTVYSSSGTTNNDSSYKCLILRIAWDLSSEGFLTRITSNQQTKIHCIWVFVWLSNRSKIVSIIQGIWCK